MSIGAAVVLGTALVVAVAASSGDDAVAGPQAAARGRQIYTTGTTASGNDFGVFLSLYGDQDRRFPGARYACIHCHGDDGLPSTEGGVGVPNIQAHRLLAPAHAGPGSTRTRPAYDLASLARAIRHGIDAGGNKLNAVMPRFDISDADMQDLQAYLTTLGTQQLAGMTRDRCVIGVAVHEGAAAAAEVATLRAFCTETNVNGGIYGRSIELVERGAAEWQRELATDTGKDSVVGLLVAGRGDDIDAGDLPVITLGGEELLVDPPARPHAFHLHPSQASQLCVAVDHVVGVLRRSAPTFALMTPAGVDPGVAQVVQRHLKRIEGAVLLDASERDLPPAKTGSDLAVLLAGPPDFKLRMLRQLGERDDVHAVYCTHKLPPGALQELPAGTLARLRLLLPVPLPAASSPAVSSFQEFLRRHDLPETHVPQRVTAMAGGIIIAEALKRCGVRASRDRLVQELQALHAFKPGLFAPVTFAGGRHVGVRGAQVVRIDPETRAVEPWSDWSEPR